MPYLLTCTGFLWVCTYYAQPNIWRYRKNWFHSTYVIDSKPEETFGYLKLRVNYSHKNLINNFNKEKTQIPRKNLFYFKNIISFIILIKYLVYLSRKLSKRHLISLSSTNGNENTNIFDHLMLCVLYLLIRRSFVIITILFFDHVCTCHARK